MNKQKHVWVVVIAGIAIGLCALASAPGALAGFHHWKGRYHARRADIQHKRTASVGSVSLSTSSIPVNTQCDAYVSVGSVTPVPDGGQFTLLSSNPAVASVPAAPNNTVTLLSDSQTTSSIKVTGVAHGQATITASSQYGTVTAATINVN
ncbi:MAG: hypothetical protein ACP5VE_06635 [Chthonomonadales bacterium]